MMINIYGIKNCDTCRKALKQLSAANIDHQYSDFRLDGLSSDNLDKWLASVGWEKLLNRRGTTWRNLSDEVKSSINESLARDLMLENPTLIKRPVFESGEDVVVGFTKAEQAALGL